MPHEADYWRGERSTMTPASGGHAQIRALDEEAFRHSTDRVRHETSMSEARRQGLGPGHPTYDAARKKMDESWTKATEAGKKAYALRHAQPSANHHDGSFNKGLPAAAHAHERTSGQQTGKSLQTGVRGGTYYVSSAGTKVYTKR